jgi:hypothetical protein
VGMKAMQRREKGKREEGRGKGRGGITNEI